MSARRILIADHSFVVRRGLRVIIESQPGWSVCGEVATGWEVVPKVTELRPDVSVLEVNLPGLNGLEATLSILKAVPDAKVLIFTAADDEDTVQRAIQCGVKGYVHRSDAERDLVDALRAIMDNKFFFTSAVAKSALENLLERKSKPPKNGKALQNGLSRRQRQVLQLLAEGWGNQRIAVRLAISVRTVELHRAIAMKRVGARSLAELVRYAIRKKIVEP